MQPISLGVGPLKTYIPGRSNRLLRAAIAAIRRNNGVLYWPADNQLGDGSPNLLSSPEFAAGLTDAPTRSGLLTLSSMAGYDNAIAFGHDGVTSSFAYKNISTTNGLTYSLSVLVQMDDGLAPTFGTAAGADPASSFGFAFNSNVVVPTLLVTTSLGGGLYQVSYTGVSSGTAGANWGVVKYAGNNNRTFKVTGYKLELGSLTAYTPQAVLRSRGAFTDSTGLSPVTTVGDVLGLIGDRTQPMIARRNLALNTGFSGAVAGTPGTAPTNWAVSFGGGTLGVTPNGNGNDLSVTTTAARHFFTSTTYAAATNTTTYASAEVVSNSGLQIVELIGIGTAPAGFTGTYQINGNAVLWSAVPVAGDTITFVLSTTTTAGNLSFRLGVGVSNAVTGSATLRNPSWVLPADLGKPYQRIDAGQGEWFNGVYADNLLTFPEDFTNAVWLNTVTGGGSTPVRVANDAIAPDGTLTADRVTFSAAVSGDQSTISQNGSGLVVGAAYTASASVKAATPGDIGKQLVVRSVAGGMYAVITLTADYQRISRTENAALASGVDGLSIGLRPALGGSTGTVGVHIWGAKLEPGSTATPYAPISALPKPAWQATTANKPLITRVPERLGPELVVNGDGSSLTGWTGSTGYSVVSGTFKADGTTAAPVLQQNVGVQQGKTYQVTFTQSGRTAGNCYLVLGGTQPAGAPNLIANQTYSFVLTATTTAGTLLLATPSGTFDGSFDNISVREVLEFSNAMSFDGSNDFLQTGLTTGNEGWVCAGLTFGGAAGVNETVFSSGAGTATTKGVWLLRNGTSTENAMRMYVGNGTALDNAVRTSTALRNIPRVVEGGWTASEVSVGVDGVIETAARTGDATTTQTATIGAYAGGGFDRLSAPMTAEVYCAKFPPAADRAIIRRWIGSLQGQLVGLGPELVTNGTFDSATGWLFEATSPGVAPSVASGSLVFNSPEQYTAASRPLDVALTPGKSYVVSIACTAYTSGTFQVALTGGTTVVPISGINATGVRSAVITAATANTTVFISRLSGGPYVASFDNISVREVGL